MLRWFRIARLILYLALVFTGLLPVFSASGQDAPSRAYILRIDDIIDPNYAKYLERGLERAQEEGGEFVIIVIDTPGGLVSSMRDMVKNIFASPIPVITFVSPSGAQAGSAGTFITAAGHLAVMAPGTNIGAATPISGTGQDLPDTLAGKVTNDAAALIRSIAEDRGRNADVLEETVRQASSFTANEALDLNIIDFIANDLDDLVARLDGMTVAVEDGEATLNTQGISCTKPRASCTEVRLSFVERFLAIISDPNIAGILVTLGGLGLFLEFLNPGSLFPGIFGAIMLALAFTAAGNLPLNWAGAGLILFAFVLFFFEIQVSGFGILGFGGLVAFIFGTLFLFAPFAADPPSISGPRVSINPWLITGLGSSFALGIGTLVYLVWRGKKAVPMRPTSRLIGMVGRVTVALDPVGTAYVANEPWTGESVDDSVIQAGERVEVVGFEGLRVIVRKVPKLLPAVEGLLEAGPVRLDADESGE